MKKINLMFTMLAIIFAALSFTACGSDDDDNASGGGSSTSYIEVNFNGKTYREKIYEEVLAQIDNSGVDEQGKNSRILMICRPTSITMGLTLCLVLFIIEIKANY